MEEYDATYDSDDEVDFSKMDMVRGEVCLFPRKTVWGNEQYVCWVMFNIDFIVQA